MGKLLLKFKHLFSHFENRIEETSDWVAGVSANPWFLIVHAIWWGLWMGLKVEAFPYGLLTLIVSLEAIILSSLILASSNREGHIEKKIARKTLSNTKETNWMAEESLEILRDLQEEVRRLSPEEE